MCNRMHYERHGSLARLLYMLGEHGTLHVKPLRLAVFDPYIAGVRCMQLSELLPGDSRVHRNPDVGVSAAVIIVLDAAASRYPQHVTSIALQVDWVCRREGGSHSVSGCYIPGNGCRCCDYDLHVVNVYGLAYQ